MYKILLVDDENLSRDILATYVEGLLGHKVVQARSGDEAFDLYQKDEFSIVLSDIKMPGMNGLDLLRAIKAHPNGNNTKVVLFTGFAQVDTAVQALRDGAYDYLFKPIDVNRLGDIIKQIIAELQFSIPAREYEKEMLDSQPLRILRNGAYLDLPNLGKVGIFSNKMKQIIELAEKLHADRELPVLIEGESGTGKEVIASLIHYGSHITRKPFVTINCAAIAPSLFESELFGYEGGTFTGGREEGKIGKLEMAQGGTILLDEIGEMPLDMQPKLLRVIQEKCFYRVGGTRKIDLDVRIISSTNRNLKKLVNDNLFRYDLFYRINSAYILMPSLADQKDAIAPLAQMFLIEFAEKRDKRFRLFSKKAVEMLEVYPWQGNIRELKNVIERVVLLHNEIEVRPEHLAFLEFESADILDKSLPILKIGQFRLPEEDLDLEELEFEIVKMAMDKFNGNKTQTAKYLGLTPSALRSRLR